MYVCDCATLLHAGIYPSIYCVVLLDCGVSTNFVSDFSLCSHIYALNRIAQFAEYVHVYTGTAFDREVAVSGIS